VTDIPAGETAPGKAASVRSRRRELLARVNGDAAGALSATLIALPQSLSLGAVAYAALGPEYVGAGVVAGLVTSIVSNLMAATAFSVQCQVHGARAATTTIVAGLVASLAATPELRNAAGPDASRVLALAAFAVALAGFFQLAFGIARLGRAIKYVPYPVIAGFMNGVALLILLSQVRAILGLEDHATLQQTLQQLGAAKWGAVATTAAATAGVILGARFVPRIPAMLAGFLTGIACHYAIAAMAPGAVGPVVGALPSIVPSASELDALKSVVATTDLRLLWSLVLPQAFLIAIVGSIDGLLAAVVVDAVTRGHHRSDRLLMSQGLANVVGAIAGALPAQLNAHTPVASFRAGGRTPLSTVLHSLFMLAIVVAAGSLLALVPIAALAGLMVYIAGSMIDRWSRDLVLRIRGSVAARGEIAINIGIVVVVALAQVAMNIMVALTIGVAVSVALLLWKLSGSPVRRHLDAATRASFKVRPHGEREALSLVASRIHVLELQGELFFGTADRLQAEIEKLAPECRYLILDFRRLHQIDASGARALDVIGHRAERRGFTVCLSHLRVDEPRGRYLRALGLDRVVPTERWFADLDRALEWAEDGLLASEGFERSEATETPFSQMALFHGLTAEELGRVEPYLQRIELVDGDTVCLEGDPGDRLYLIARGNVSIKVKLDSASRARRLATFSQGVMFGEMALLEGKPRSADAYAKGDSVVLYSLTIEAFERILVADPFLGLRLQRNISRELAARLRATSTALRVLE